ncbi:hypothetical protein CRV24_000837 [Beauveria bassiana]|nr:hypothetical protein CRV24_000837 [Beauveria bassiana]
MDFVEGPRAGPSASGGVVALVAWRASMGELFPCMSADDGAVDALLWRDELSVEVACVVLERPLPLSSLKVGKNVVLMRVMNGPQESVLGRFGGHHLGTAIEGSTDCMRVAFQNLE